jgi:hypothetical protein
MTARRCILSPSHLRRLSERVGGEWRDARDAEVQRYRERRLPRGYAGPPAVAAVMLDGGRYQSRAEGAGRGVTDPAWKEIKVACCQTYAAREHRSDPQPSRRRSSWTGRRWRGWPRS